MSGNRGDPGSAMAPAAEPSLLQPGSVERVMVALSGSASERSALHVAATLASGLRARLEALLVEDPEVERIAGWSAQRPEGKGEAEPVSAHQLQRALAARRRRAREDFDAVAREPSVQATFRVVHRSFSSELEDLSTPADVVVIHRLRARRERVVEPVGGLDQELGVPVVVLPQRPVHQRPRIRIVTVRRFRCPVVIVF